jgi:hypothetical protein
MINVRSIPPLTASETAGRGLGRGEAAIWYPDGDMAAYVHGNLGTLPDPIDPLEIAQLFAAAPELYEALKGCLALLQKDGWYGIEVTAAENVLAKVDAQ